MDLRVEPAKEGQKSNTGLDMTGYFVLWSGAEMLLYGRLEDMEAMRYEIETYRPKKAPASGAKLREYQV